MEVFKLFGSIFVKTDEAEASLSKTETKATSLASKLGSGITSAAKWGAAIVAGATAAAGAMTAAAKQTAETLDVIDKASIRMGISAESYQELAYAAGLSGVEVSKLEEAAKKLNGTGITLDEAIAQLQAIEDEGERSAAAVAMFGESAYELTPLLNAGTEGMAAMVDEANALGLVMSQDSVSAGAAMNDMFSKLEQTFGQVKNSIMIELMPYVMEILQWLIDNLPLIAETVQKVMDLLMPIIAPILDAVMSLFKGVFSLINGDLETFGEEMRKILGNLGEAAIAFGENILLNLLKGLQNMWGNVTDWVSEKIDWLVDKVTFWNSLDEEARSTSNPMPVHGRHASGLRFVPYDGYKAELHRGETVMNASDTGTMLTAIAGLLASQKQSSGSQKVELVVNLDGRAIARQLYDPLQDETKMRGTNLAMA